MANPYQAPTALDGEAAAKDPLRFPAIGYIIHSALMLLLALLALLLFAYVIWLFREFPDHERVREAWSQLPGVCWIVTYALLGFWCARSMLRRKWRWFVIAYSVLTFMPFTGWLASPLGALTLIRLRRRDVWESFSSVRDAERPQ